MGDALAEAPSWLPELDLALRGAGFSLLEERRYDESFGNYLATYSRDRIRIRPVKDRDEWRIDLWDARTPTNNVGQPRCTSPRMIQAVAQGETDEASIEHPPAEQQAAWLVANLDMASRLVKKRSTWRAIHKLGQQFTRRTFGVELPE